MTEKLQPPKNAKPIPGYPHHLATADGKIFSLARNRYMKPARQQSGILVVGMHSYTPDGRRSTSDYVHRLVALAWLEKPTDPAKTRVIHIDRNYENNHYKNLRWVSVEEHMEVTKPLRKRKLDKAAVKFILKNYSAWKRLRKLTVEQVHEMEREIEVMRKMPEYRLKGTLIAEHLAKKYNVSPSLVWRVRRREYLPHNKLRYQGWCTAELARKYNVSLTAIAYVLGIYGLRARALKRKQQRK